MQIYFLLFTILFGYSSTIAQTLLKPTVEVGTERHIWGRIPIERLYFKCSFTPSHDSSILYQVYWFIDGQIVYMPSLVTGAGIATTHLKSENGLRLPSQISCAIQTKTRLSDAGHMFPRSNDFFAGIQTVPSTVYLERGGTVNVGLYLTVPFGCPYLHPHDQESENCHTEISISTPKQDNCDIDIVLQDGCALRLQRREWNLIQHITLRHIDDRHTLPTSVKIITLSMDNSQGTEWSTFHQNVTVNVIESNEQWRRNSCTANCPGIHMTTFGNRSFDITQTGTFLLYKFIHTDGYQMEVAIKTQPCSKGACICGVAAIAGGDVFVLDYCHGSRTGLDFTKCQHNLIGVRRMSASSYMILLPTGTQVLAEILPVDGYVMQVHVYPSFHDVRGTEGLCANLGSSQLITKNGVASSVDDFIRSWGTVDLNTIKSSGYVAPIAPSGPQFCICESGISKPNCTRIPFMPYICQIGTREFLSGQCFTKEVFG